MANLFLLPATQVIDRKSRVSLLFPPVMSFPLPPELTLDILSHLTVPSIQALCSVSRGWHALIRTHEAAIYRALALREFSVPSRITTFDELTDSKILSSRSLAASTDWKSFCATRHRTELAWLGKAASSITSHSEAGRHVHRFKVDEKRGFIVATGTSLHPGLRVTEMESGSLLWSLSGIHVTRYAHCEYDEGYVIFNRQYPSNDKEVWRFLEDPDTIPAPGFALNAPPDGPQLNASASAPGRFIPWAVIRPPGPNIHAFRFVYPTLAAASETSIYIWEVPSGTLLQAIDIGEDIGAVCYVEISRQPPGEGGLVFVCGTDALCAFSCESADAS
uniref:F-box domain-containing protein n=1 Tax=Mycena chlorophos TaxID=658473 RepID=A0ABQ0M027_MYCCL|nr:predicted protein [Mycena chlorophos]